MSAANGCLEHDYRVCYRAARLFVCECVDCHHRERLKFKPLTRRQKQLRELLRDFDAKLAMLEERVTQLEDHVYRNV